MTPEQLAAAHPEAAASLRAEGASAERTRIQGVEAQLIPGHEALVSTLKFDGTSSPGDAAMAINAAERQVRTSQAAALASDAPAALPVVASATVVPPAKTVLSKTDLDAQAKAHMAAHPGVSYIAAVKHVQQQGA